MRKHLCMILFLLACKPGAPAADPLSAQWAHYLRGNPGATMDPEKAVVRAADLRAQGLLLYRSNKDKEALVKYEEALRLVANPEIYYDYGNSLSNVPGRLDDAISAYKIGISLMPSPPANFYYNLACAQSRAGLTEDAVANLMIAYRLGKDMGIMEKDADLANVRKDPEWRRRVMTAGLPDFESPAGKVILMPVGGGYLSTRFCGKPGDTSGIVVHQWESYGQNSGIRRGTWKLDKGEVHVHYTRESGSTGTGPAEPGPRGPVYSQFTSYEKEIDARDSFRWSSQMGGVSYISGPCP